MSELEELKLAHAECSRQRNTLLNKLKAQEKRKWVGLTCVDYAEICRAADDKASALIMAEDLLKEKNT